MSSSSRSKWFVLSMVACVTVGCETKNEIPSRTAKPASAANRAACGPQTIDDEGVGRLRIGKAVEAVARECLVLHDTTALAAEGMPARKITVAFPDDTLKAEIVTGKVWRIEITSAGFSTNDSLRVGTPLQRLLALRSPRGLTGEGQLFLVTPEHCGLSFQLSNAGRLSTQVWNKAALQKLPSNTVASEILVVGCPKSDTTSARH